MNPTEFEAAKRSLVFSIIHKEKTVSDASFQSLLSYFRGVPGDHNLQLCKKIWELSSEEVGEIGRKHVPPLFDFTRANVAVTCHPSKLQEICQGFKRLGCELQLLSLEDPLLHEI